MSFGIIHKGIIIQQDWGHIQPVKRLAFVHGENPVYFLIGEFTNPGPSMENECLHIHYYAVVYTCALWYSNMALENALSMELCRI